MKMVYQNQGLYVRNREKYKGVLEYGKNNATYKKFKGNKYKKIMLKFYF